jgi:nitroreductase
MRTLKPNEFFRGIKKILKEKPAPPPKLADNPVLKVLFSRRSVRKFKAEPIPGDVMKAILEAGRLAPSGVNLQSWTFGVFTRESWNKKFDRPLPFNGEGAVIIMGDAHRVRQGIPEFPHKPLVEYTLAVLNAGIAAYAMNIAAESCGVSSIMLSDTGKTGFYDALYLKEKLSLPDGVFPLTTLVLGYAKKTPTVMPPRFPLESITFNDNYRETSPETLESWLEQMQAGYRASKITSSFSGQLRHYRSQINNAEEDLKKIIFYGEK